MPDTFTSDKTTALKMGTGENENTWGQRLNDEALVPLSLAIAGYQAKSVAGGVDVSLTATEAQYGIVKFTGTLTASINVIVPAASGNYIVHNATSGAYTLTVKTSAGTGIAVTQGYKAALYCDGTDVLKLMASDDFISKTTPQLGGDLDANGNQIKWAKGADVASATALPVLTDGNYFDVTGTTTITSINTCGGDGTIAPTIKLHFDGALTLTHHATDLILPGGANITTAAGDEAEFVEYASGDWRCVSYLRAAGRPLNTGVTDKLGVGFEGTSYPTGNTGAGTVTLVAANGNIQHGTVTGAFTLGAPTFVGVGYIEWEITNDATGGYSPDLSTNFTGISGTYDATALAVNLLRITKCNTGTYLEIAQGA